jgi:DNA-binding LacI/PurR family transcriptional regulator
LQAQGIQLHVERCSDARLRSIALQKAQPNELFFLASVAHRHQLLFEKARKHALIIGSPADGITLPFMTADLAGAISHATRLLLRSGFDHLHLLIARLASKGIKESVDAFERACREWPHQPVYGRTEFIPLQNNEHLAAARRFASRVNGRLGVIVSEPVPVGMVQTALLERGVGMPHQVEVVAVFPPLASVNLCPPLRFYRMHDARLVKEITDLAVRFFETGKLRRVSKRLPPELMQS